MSNTQLINKRKIINFEYQLVIGSVTSLWILMSVCWLVGRSDIISWKGVEITTPTLLSEHLYAGTLLAKRYVFRIELYKHPCPYETFWSSGWRQQTNLSVHPSVSSNCPFSELLPIKKSRNRIFSEFLFCWKFSCLLKNPVCHTFDFPGSSIWDYCNSSM